MTNEPVARRPESLAFIVANAVSTVPGRAARRVNASLLLRPE